MTRPQIFGSLELSISGIKPGTHIDTAAADLITFSRYIGETAKADFNGTPLTANYDDSVPVVVRRWAMLRAEQAGDS